MRAIGEVLHELGSVVDDGEEDGSRSHGRGTYCLRSESGVAATSMKETAMQCGNHYVAEPARDLIGLLQDYRKTRPEVSAAWCFGIGLFLGWRLRP